MSQWTIRIKGEISPGRGLPLLVVVVDNRERYHIYNMGVRKLYDDGGWIVPYGAGEWGQIVHCIALDIINNDHIA